MVGTVVLGRVYIEDKKWKWERWNVQMIGARNMAGEMNHQKAECRHGGSSSHNEVGTCLLMANLASSVHAPIIYRVVSPDLEGMLRILVGC